MFKSFLFCLILIASNLLAADQFDVELKNGYFASITIKQTAEEGVIHCLWVGEITDSLTRDDIEENTVVFKSQEDIEVAMLEMQSWLVSHFKNDNLLTIICDEYHVSKEYQKIWNDLSQKAFPEFDMNFMDIREDVRRSFGQYIELYEWCDFRSNPAIMHLKSYEAKIIYLSQSSPFYFEQFTMDKAAVRSLNFQQLRAYFWLIGVFKPKNDDKVEYWISIYAGKKVYAQTGRFLLEDTNVVDRQCSGGEGVIVDIYLNPNSEYTVFCIATMQIYKRRQWEDWYLGTMNNIYHAHYCFEWDF